MMSVKSNNQLNTNDFNYSIIVNDQSKKINLKLARLKPAIYSIKIQHLNRIEKQRTFNIIKYGRNNKENNEQRRFITIWFNRH